MIEEQKEKNLEIQEEPVSPYSTEKTIEEAQETDLGGILEEQFEKYVVSVRRVAKVLKGGKKLSFSAMVVVGNKNGLVGYSLGKANEVPAAIDKAARRAMKNLIKVEIKDGTIPHQVISKFGATKVLLKPAKMGTGVIAGLTLRAVMDAAGISNVVTKIIGSTNPIAVVQAAFEALKKLKSKEEILSIRKQQ